MVTLPGSRKNSSCWTLIIKPAEQKPSKALSSLELMNAGMNFSVFDSEMFLRWKMQFYKCKKCGFLKKDFY